MRTIALFGGSFDPPHLGHEAVVTALLSLSEIDKVLIMPTFLNPFKSSSFAPAQKRLRWLKEIFCTYKNVFIDSFEVQKNEKVPTITTVEYLLESYDKVYVVIGADNLKDLQKWYKFDELKRKVVFIIASRDEITVPKEFKKLLVKQDISSTALRSTMNKDQLCKINAEEIMNYYKEKNDK
ncbi:nicotinate (nicotinamide) nucleotide adenylyltransferase [Sulfurimonas sp. SAG-AH-194-C20]|nr:nicotinate (nicotinamide) nucleotide adenylyltransferase [Sulfurimonas sp. SAG-AH-194-C20]MDF1879536.1 nicotinate (nicotinamide) nucleotide adenylyltransferase [Sulfurimonas sp. SAG-AH-194-C20]